ncbi:MAG: hypothetical protein ACO3I0_07305 [Limisphaerales bacterium]
MGHWFRIALGMVLAGWGAYGATVPEVALEDPIQAGPVFSEFQTVWESGRKTEILGPLAMWETTADERNWGVYPLMSYQSAPIVELEELDVLYPLFTWRKQGTESRWQFFQFLNFAGASYQSEDPVVRRTVFPFYFQQQSRSGTNDYIAVLPFYGHARNRMFRDEFDFYMFPLYLRSRKGELVTKNYLMPFVHTRHGPGWDGWQVWPLFGWERKETGWTTNHLGDRVVSPGGGKVFAMWPLFFNEKLRLGTPQATTNFAVLPFYSQQRGTNLHQTSVLWPFFSRTEDRSKGFVEWGAPWPFIGWADSTNKTARRFFPFYGVAKAPGVESRLVMWPFYTHRKAEDGAMRRDRWRVGFFLYDDVRLQSKTDGRYRRERALWPFFVWKRDLEGREHLQVLELLETLFRNRDSVQRNYSPLWALYRSENNPNTGRSSESVLWNLYRRDVSPTRVRTSSFFGLIQTLRGDDDRCHWRWLWLPNPHFRETSLSMSGSVAVQDPNPSSPRFLGVDTARGAERFGTLSHRRGQAP